MTDMPPSESVDEHLERILASIDVLKPQKLALDSVLGLFLAEDVDALIDVPSFDNSSMDGYAVRRADLLNATEESPMILPVIADLAAGASENVRVTTGSVARIMTGAPIPDGADAVIPLEDTDRGIDRVTIFTVPAPGAHIRHAGGDVRAGDAVLVIGERLGARQVSAAAAIGRSELLVHRAPRVGIISTGSELTPPGIPLGRGQIHDSNSFLLAGAVAEAGGTPLRIGSVPDDEGRLQELLTRNQSHVDAFILSGGVSVGAYDVVKALLASRGTRFGPVRMQPGKPQGFGFWEGDIPIFCLPGNPVSAFVSFQVFVLPALKKLQGRSPLVPSTVVAVATEGWRSPPGRQQYMPVIIQPEADAGSPQPRIRPATSGGSSSHLVASLPTANALAIVPEDVTHVHAGDQITMMPLGE